MKKGLENIEEVFKQTFNGFEADVDPGVWANIQSSITAGGGTESSVASSGVGKSIVLKFVAGIVALGAITTTIYHFSDNSNSQKEIEVTQELPIGNNEINSNVLVDKENNQYVKIDATESGAQKNDKKESDLASLNSSEEKKRLEILTPENNVVKDLVVEENNQDLNKQEVVNKPQKEKMDPVKTEKVVLAEKDKTEKVFVGNIQASVTSGKAPLDVMFDVETENVVSYLWDFGDNSFTSSDASTLHTFNEPGEYKVKLTVLDKNANPKTLIKIIIVEKNITSTLGFIQDAFSPNGDGTNDIYRLKSAKNIKTFNATIRDALTGKIVYEWNNIEEGWDGADVSGRIMNNGTSYALTIYAEGTDGETHIKQQIITIIK